jgi:hypothetical protein
MRALWGVALVGVVALTACGDSSAEPRVLPSLSAPASPSASPIPTGPAAAHDAAEFARFVYAEIERAFIERDPAIVEAISTPQCESCRRFIDSIAGLRDSNGRVEGYRITVRTAVAPADSGTTARVDVIRDSTASVEYDAAGKVVSREPGYRGIEEQMDLVRQGATWRVTSIIRIRVTG